MTDTPTVDGALDLAPWARGAFVAYPRIDLDSLGIDFVAPRHEVTGHRGRILSPAFPVSIRLNGAIGGVRVFTDSDRLRQEAERLLDAADHLDALQAIYQPVAATLALDTPTQEDTCP